MNNTTCPDCNGTGLDPAHHWPDGTAAPCASCEGYGDLGPLPTWKEFHQYMREWAKGHGPKVSLICDEFLSGLPKNLEAMRKLNEILSR